MAVDKTDEELLRAFAGGDRPALAELARRYERPLLGLCNALLAGQSDRVACDAVQETWVRVIRFAGSFDGRSRLKTWLYRIAINQCRSLLTARPVLQASEQLDDEPSGAPGPTETAQNNELASRVRQAIARLSAEKRTALLLCYHVDMTHEEAAEILEIPLGTLKSRLHAALQELRERLSAETKS
ncbi:MAG: RNA polymerase sigma factor [Phycisphaerae bacterium]